MEKYIAYPQLLIICTFCYYLMIGSKLPKTFMTWTLFAGSALLGGAVAYRMTFPTGSNVAQWVFQLSNSLVFGSLLAYEVKNSFSRKRMDSQLVEYDIDLPHEDRPKRFSVTLPPPHYFKTDDGL